MRYSASELKISVYSDADHLTEIFKDKYGKPTECFPKLTILDIRDYDVTYLCKWKQEDSEAYTAFSTSDFKYYANDGTYSYKMMEANEIYRQEQKKEGY